ncbi:RNA 2',3'-cyclic phosphodiesterase [Desulfoprunum benzoelyticum]|uniref:RNA 2',3'-cyclic phosphodiesterase n=1 Tax=Desulfoprunum benzoelyticum TaxID=1506996 RepID=A0A840UPG7_9BACT|nr:RNA 2',3'-cyclic phosphodiesterase [Desulfoprunum benzoelyticum]MBB5348147.1 2'-5' RNA ligase [Desulfoprunum benzoelyticum]MBM9530243.1 RNA 2',3'-cyclic phosphodiesterase [Desulfoprunum benzoelyticum]
MTRLFTAVDIPTAIQDRLHQLGRQVPGARAVPAHQLHLTLTFIGAVDDQRLQPIRQALAAIAAPPFAITIQGIGCFPPRGPARIIWAGVRPQPLLHRLQGLIEASLVPCGIIGETRSYSPHITIARIKTPAAGDRKFAAAHAAFITEEIPVEEFILYSSRLTPQGAIHTVENRYPLIP